MAIPRVFISSTCYDLKHIRENLKYFVKTIGYEPVLSDEGDVFYDPTAHTHDSCLKEVETCQLFILIIGGRYGGKFKDGESSITNHEYREAIRNNIPVFALVENSVYSDHHVYTINKSKNPKIVNDIAYPSVDSLKIFGFIDEVRRNSENNAIFPFRDFSDMESYLKKQWAGMMYDFIVERSNANSAKVTNKLLDDLALATKKSEELIKLLVKSTNTESAEDSIRDIDNKVEAQNFTKLILEQFGMDRLYNTSMEQLEKADLTKPWSEFLCETNDFHKTIEEHDGDTDLVIWGTASRGVAIGHYEDDKLVPSNYPDIEKAYKALQVVDKHTREEVFSTMVNGL
ncbi:DUF4062 domain-containing protein [Vibrio parahaemolyticus]|nr:DUF4062 domain-containing protein [Vibrio parahaemolyticus]MBE4498907.1 DUF4062 domain-containing protein [Vibrio parahaemolyticus]